jgi:hypothetical protein
MARIERKREVLHGPLTDDFLRSKAAEGWEPVAVEWQRTVPERVASTWTIREDVPFGLRIANDCLGLEQEPMEKDAIVLMLDLIGEDRSLPEVADELNKRGLRTRTGAKWSPVSVFHMLPRLIQVGPQVLSSTEWAERRKHVMRIG